MSSSCINGSVVSSSSTALPCKVAVLSSILISVAARMTVCAGLRHDSFFYTRLDSRLGIHSRHIAADFTWIGSLIPLSMYI